MKKIDEIKRMSNILITVAFTLFFTVIVVTLGIFARTEIFDKIAYLSIEGKIVLIILIITLIFILSVLYVKNRILKNIFNESSYITFLPTSEKSGYVEIEKNDKLDILTGRYNKKHFEKVVNMKILEQPSTIGGMFYIDLDNIKYINFNYGHDIGDTFILKVSEVLNFFEKYDGIVSRISGDEFIVYLHGFGSEKELLNVFNEMMVHSKNFIIVTPDGLKNQVRFTSGVAWYPRNGKDFNELYKASDFALYEAKNKERGSLNEFNNELYSKNYFIIENSIAINQLIDQKLIRFAHQPIVDTKTGEIYGYEALMRSKMEAFKSPYEIIEVAVTQSKLPQLEALVAFGVYEDIEENEEKIAGRKIFLNTLPSQVLSESDGIKLQKKYGKYFSQIVLEITEQENKNEANMIAKLEYCKKFNVKVAVDDFGSGFSNEVRLLSIKPDIIKIDMVLIQGIHEDNDKQVIVTSISKFCKEKNIPIVAEGVEEKEDLEYLVKLGIDYVQGYYIARPSFDYEEIPEKIKKEIIEMNK